MWDTAIYLALFVIGLGAGLGVTRLWALGTGRSHRARLDEIIKDAERERERLLRDAALDAKTRLIEAQAEQEASLKRQKEHFAEIEQRLRQREVNADRKHEAVEQREQELKRREDAARAASDKTAKLLADAEAKAAHAKEELVRISGLSHEQAKSELVKSIEDEARRVAAAKVKAIESEAEREAKERAQRIIAGAIQRFACTYVAEKTVAVVPLPHDEMKGRIIGREGRNIRAIEAATGVDIIIDDTPEVVVLSTFNPMRREIARLALLRLVADGRIHPARIEEVVASVSEEVEESAFKAGEQATFDLGLHGMHQELIRLIGRLRYRGVNGQNLWNHSVETATIAGMMAEELGFDAALAKRAGLLHDVGKAVDHETPGAHWVVSAEQARRYGEKSDVVEAIRAHHEASPASVLGVLLQAANTMSKARPGARRDLLETYIKRLSDLESLSQSFPGVEKAYALQAGREVRVMVSYATVSDEGAVLLSRDIARRIQDTLTYPGEVRVTVLRQARATEYAK